MRDMEISCSSCGNRHRVDSRAQGLSFRCPSCSAIVKCPVACKRPPPPPFRWSSKRVAIAIGAVVSCVVVVAILGAVYRITRAPRNAVMDRAERDAPQLYKIIVDSKVGFVDASGVVVVPPRFDNAKDFREGLAPVLIEDLWGYIDDRGAVVIEPTFHMTGFEVGPGEFSEGLAAVRLGKDTEIGFIDRSGRWAIRPRFEFAESFRQGIAAVREKGVWGFVNTAGMSVASGFETTSAGGLEGFGCGRGRVRVNGQYGYIDNTGKTVIHPQFSDARCYYEGLAAVEKSGRWGFVDLDGKTAIPLTYERVGDFHEGLASIRVSGKCGYIDRAGTIVIAPQFKFAKDFHEGLSGVATGKTFNPWESEADRWGYIDRKGSVVIGITFAWVGNYDHGIAGASTDRDVGYIDKAGAWIWRRPK